jgi:hypothetical protein
VGRHREISLSIDLGINNERQGCEIGIMCVGGSPCGRGRVNEGDEVEIWLMGFIYIYEIEQ